MPDSLTQMGRANQPTPRNLDQSITVTEVITSGTPMIDPFGPAPRLIASTISCPPVTDPQLYIARSGNGPDRT